MVLQYKIQKQTKKTLYNYEDNRINFR